MGVWVDTGQCIARVCAVGTFGGTHAAARRRAPSWWLAFLAWLGVWVASNLAWAQAAKQEEGFAPIPPLVTRVTDTAATLNMAEIAALDQKIRAFEQSTGGQLAVLIVPTAQPETIEQYTIRVAEAWKIGKKGKDNGALIVLAMREKKVRIEVGYGWEGALTDQESKRIIREVMGPYFGKGQFAAGIAAGIDKIALALTKETAGASADNAQWRTPHQTDAMERLGDWLFRIGQVLLGLLVLVAILFMMAMLALLKLPTLLVGGLGGVGGYLFTRSLLVALSLGVAGLVVAALVRRMLRSARGNGWVSRGRHHVYQSGDSGAGAWSVASGVGSSVFSASTSVGSSGWSDSFSGGGGEFGGGGASGSWGDGA